ncbi:DUF771 domain-containing protein [Rummeliibacillus stabekisii]|uniref:DUF771 domain-containing protein n=1 Tax=Rummeliibacillus stabekisii TaxID=241244 RepID=A0A143HCQ8_9BACL|nr:DUF771 domain-containing protein [Rummeliibacillus stabekisii]AMW99240.1 hypothetical protein ATY39_07030 [Rummeliibacillus stabekisii]
MQQRLKVELDIQVPADMVLISKVELENLKEESLRGVYWSMQDLESRTGMKRLWLQEKILYRPQFKRQLEEFVYYPQTQGEKWSFLASKMSKFLEENFYKIFS